MRFGAFPRLVFRTAFDRATRSYQLALAVGQGRQRCLSHALSRRLISHPNFPTCTIDLRRSWLLLLLLLLLCGSPHANHALRMQGSTVGNLSLCANT